MTGMDALLGATTVFAILITKLVDAARNTLGQIKLGQKPATGDDKRESLNQQKWIWNGLALLLGVCIATIYEIDVFASLSSGANDRGVGIFGQILTGLGMGAAGSGWHEIFDATSSAAKKLNPDGAPK